MHAWRVSSLSEATSAVTNSTDAAPDLTISISRPASDPRFRKAFAQPFTRRGFRCEFYSVVRGGGGEEDTVLVTVASTAFHNECEGGGGGTTQRLGILLENFANSTILLPVRKDDKAAFPPTGLTGEGMRVNVRMYERGRRCGRGV